MSVVSKIKKINKRGKKIRIEDLPLPKTEESHIKEIAQSLSKQIDQEIFKKRYANATAILKLVGMGAFLAASVAVPNLPRILKPFLKEDEYDVWKRFNIPYLKRTLKRLERQKLVAIKDDEKYQIVEITDAGRRRILKFALDELTIEKPKFWDRQWRLVSYDIPSNLKSLRQVFQEYLSTWNFYPLHESVFLHAYPCVKQVVFLREYLRIGEYVRIFLVSKIENDTLFREFFGV